MTARSRAGTTGGPHSPADAVSGDAADPATLLPVVYDELRRLAGAYMRRERRGVSIQATALVHEAFLRLRADRKRPWQNRAHFCAIAAHAMRQILVEHARARATRKRGGGWGRVTLEDVHAAKPASTLDLEALDEALERLAVLDASQARLVELRYFGGLTIEETAEALGVSPATVKREWVLARAWLHRELAADQPGRGGGPAA
ncbi:MAG: sigma-70 family RNA polymerase sigma factor [Vicinamibacterales bacterium]